MVKDKAKVLFIDIESMAELSWVWELYETNSIEVERPGHLLTVAWKWQGEKTKVIGQCDFKGYKPKSANDKELCKFVWKLIDEADIIIGHNARSFDMKKINYRFMVNGLTPPSPYKIVDTLSSMRSIAKAPSNKLDTLGKIMEIGKKVEHEGWGLWKKCYLGDPNAWARMKKYNKQDVDLLEKWYMILRPWISRHPNYNLYNGTERNCPKCGSMRLHRRGVKQNKQGVRAEYQCQNCYSWSSGATIKRLTKDTLR